MSVLNGAQLGRRHLDRDVLRPRGSDRLRPRKKKALLPEGLWCIEMSLHADDAQDDQLRHHLPRAPGVLQPGRPRAHPARGGHAPGQRQPQRQQRRPDPRLGDPRQQRRATGGTSSPTTSGSCARKSSICSSTPTSRTGTFRSGSTFTGSSPPRCSRSCAARGSACTSTAPRPRETLSCSGAASTTGWSTFAPSATLDKYGARTLGTDIPIVSEEESRAAKPDYYLVLPWHFREEFLQRE